MTAVSKKRIGIFVIAYNAVNKLDWTLDRIPEEVWQKVDEVFLFDDCSTDNTYYAALGYKQAKGLEKLTVHRNSKNLRYGGNQKAGYQYAIARDLDIVVMLHADGQYAPEVLPDLLRPLETDQADMVFGSRMCEGGAPLAGGMPFYKFIGNRILTSIENNLIGMNLTEFHSGYRLYSCEALKRVPFMLNSNEWHFDTDILIQFHEAGLRIVERPIPTYYGDEICYVNGLAYAFNCVKSAVKYRLHKSGLRPEPKYHAKHRRYVYKETDPSSSHAQILNWVERERPERVLEIGTATGYLTAELQKLGCKVTGIEQDQEMATIAQEFCETMIVGDIETINLDDLGLYDAIIFGNVLDHARNPQLVLQRVSGLLKRNGNVVLSVPNVTNIRGRLNLFFRRFNYSRIGILDESHLRLFKLDGKKNLTPGAGLDVVDINAPQIRLRRNREASNDSSRRSLNINDVLSWFRTNLRAVFFGYKLTLICRPKE
jgi:glycosyltransferase involved in cell wall biosynthesis